MSGRGSAEIAVGRALLRRESPGGGTSGGPENCIDKARAGMLSQEMLSGREMHEFLLSVAREASREAESRAETLRSQLLRRARAVAVESDSLSLHLYVQELEAKRDDV